MQVGNFAPLKGVLQNLLQTTFTPLMNKVVDSKHMNTNPNLRGYKEQHCFTLMSVADVEGRK